MKKTLIKVIMMNTLSLPMCYLMVQIMAYKWPHPKESLGRRSSHSLPLLSVQIRRGRKNASIWQWKISVHQIQNLRIDFNQYNNTRNTCMPLLLIQNAQCMHVILVQSINWACESETSVFHYSINFNTNNQMSSQKSPTRNV